MSHNRKSPVRLPNDDRGDARPPLSPGAGWVERTLNSPRFFYAMIGILCSCYITFAAVDHLASKARGAKNEPIALRLDFDKKPPIPVPGPSEYGGLFYVRPDGEAEAKAKAETGKEEVADAAAPAASVPEIPAKEGADVDPFNIEDLLPAGTVVKPAQETPEAPAAREFKTVQGFSNSGSGGSFGGGSGGSAGTSASVEAPQLAALGPAAARPLGAAGPVRPMTTVNQAARPGAADPKSASGVRGADGLPEGGAAPPRMTASETLAETPESAITAAGALPQGIGGAGAGSESSQRPDRNPSSAGLKSGGGGGGGAGRGETSSSSGGVSDSCVTINTTNGPQTFCNGQTTTGGIPVIDGAPVDPFGPDPYASEYDTPPGGLVGEGDPLKAGEGDFFQDPTAGDIFTETFQNIGGAIHGAIGGVVRWWNEDVVAGNPILKGISDGVNGAIDWLDEKINIFLGKNPLDPANRGIHNFFKGAYEWLVGGGNVNAKPDLKRDLFNSQTIYKYQRQMHSELKTAGNDKKRRTEILLKYQRKFVMEAYPEYLDEVQEYYRNLEQTTMENCRMQCYDLAERIDAIHQARDEELARLNQIPMTRAAEEFVAKLLGPDLSGPQSSDRQKQMELQGIHCGPDMRIVEHPHTGQLACTHIDPNPLSRAWTWFGRLLVDGSDWLNDRTKEANEVNRRNLDKGDGILESLAEAVISPFAWAGGILAKGLFPQAFADKEPAAAQIEDGKPRFTSCGPGTRATVTSGGILCTDAKTGAVAQMDETGAGYAGSPAPKTESVGKKEDKGFFGWVADGFSAIGKGIGSLFGFGEKKKPKMPNCGPGTSPQEYGGAWMCLKTNPPLESAAASQPSAKAVSPVKFETKQPNYNYADKPDCGAGYFARQEGKVWNCVRVAVRTPAGPNVRLGEGAEGFLVSSCPQGTRRVVTNRPRPGDAECMRVKAKGAGIFMPTNNPYRPWLELPKCPPNQETVISHKPAPGDMTCRTPASTRPGVQYRLNKGATK